MGLGLDIESAKSKMDKLGKGPFLDKVMNDILKDHVDSAAISWDIFRHRNRFSEGVKKHDRVISSVRARQLNRFVHSLSNEQIKTLHEELSERNQKRQSKTATGADYFENLLRNVISERQKDLDKSEKPSLLSEEKLNDIHRRSNSTDVINPGENNLLSEPSI